MNSSICSTVRGASHLLVMSVYRSVHAQSYTACNRPGLFQRWASIEKPMARLISSLGAGVLVELIALVEIDLRVFVVAHVAGFAADVLSDSADALAMLEWTIPQGGTRAALSIDLTISNSDWLVRYS